MRTIFLIFFAALLVSGCSSQSTPAGPLPVGSWTSITMNQSGGIMGLSRSLQIASNGTFTASDDRAEKKVEGVLSADELFDLNQKIAALKGSFNPPKDLICGDCFVYDLDIQGNGKDIRAQLNDVSLPESGFEPLVTFLREALDKVLK
jgi:hypothetical protein